MTQLRSLRLNYMHAEGDKCDGATQLLQVLKTFMRLETLHIRGLGIVKAEVYRHAQGLPTWNEERGRPYLRDPVVYPAGHEVWPPCSPAYTSLTASTLLRDLKLHSNTGGKADLGTIPKGIWAHMLPPGHVLPHLTRLSACVDEEAVNQLASSCPNLVELTIDRGHHGDSRIPATEEPDLYPWCHRAEALRRFKPGQSARLSELQQLTKLALTDAHRPELEAIAAITGLRDLQLTLDNCAPGWGDVELLTALKQLTRLDCRMDDENVDENGDMNGAVRYCSWLGSVTHSIDECAYKVRAL